MRLPYEGKEYGMDNLKEELSARYLSGGLFNANFYWFIANLLTQNGYGHYVDMFHKHAVNDYEFGVLSLAALCNYDIKTIYDPCFIKADNEIDALFYSLVEMNKSVYFCHTLSEINSELAKLRQISDYVKSVERICNDVVGLIKDDINMEDELINETYSGSTARLKLDLVKNYITDKYEYIQQQAHDRQNKLGRLMGRIDAGVNYYNERIAHYKEEVSIRIAEGVFGGIYKTPYDNTENSTSGLKKTMAKIAKRLSEHPIQKLDELNSLITKPFDYDVQQPPAAQQPQQQPASAQQPQQPQQQPSAQQQHQQAAQQPQQPPQQPQQPTPAQQQPPPVAFTPLSDIKHFDINIEGCKIGFALNIAAPSVDIGEIYACANANGEMWWRQCGRWGQWVFTYCASDGCLTKWEIGYKQNNGEKSAFYLDCAWHYFVGKNLTYLKQFDDRIEYGANETKSYVYIDSRSCALIRKDSIPEIQDADRRTWRKVMK